MDGASSCPERKAGGKHGRGPGALCAQAGERITVTSPTSLIIDCDPGVDDAIALFLAFASPELDILAITTVAGNVGGELTARNARIIRQLAGRSDVPVYAGCTRPMVRVAVEADEIHGTTGLGPLPLFEPDHPLAAGHSVNVIVQTVMERPPRSV